MAQAQAQFPAALATQLQLQVNAKPTSSPSPPTLNLVPATPGLPTTSKPSTSDQSTSNPSTLSKHKGLPVLPYLVTPKEEKTHAAILGLWEHEENKSSSKVTLSSKGPPITSGSSKVVTSMGAEAGRKALLALQTVAAEDSASISIGKCQG
jgi:hypothetical protein